MPQTPVIPPLVSGGIMLTYRCTNACKHCLYRCSPSHDDLFMTEERIDETFAALAAEPSLYGVHIAGGEATLDWDRLLYAIDSAKRHGVEIDYLETNAYWCKDEATATEGFTRLRQAGLRAVLISASLFHNEFTPLRQTRAAIKVARKIFGRGGVLVWTEDVLSMMERYLDDDKTHPLRISCEQIGLSPSDIWMVHNYLTPGGRAAEKLADGCRRVSPDRFTGDECAQTLRGTQHFHIDPAGNLFTGKCPGISVASVDDLHPEIDADRFPVYWTLAAEGPTGAWRRCSPDFTPDPKGYISKCHFCLELRKHLREIGEYEELRPDEFYR